LVYIFAPSEIISGRAKKRKNQMIDIGPKVKADESFVAKCRFHQSKYRATILKECSAAGKPR
jgi:hypothetical protein